MKIPTVTSFLICLFCLAINAQTYDNYRKEYVLMSVTEGNIEVQRTHRRVLCDYQPSGLYVRKGERITFQVGELDADYRLSSMIGFKPMWGNHNKSQENILNEGVNTVTATQEGILFFIFVKKKGYDTEPVSVDVKVKGGKAFPLYQIGQTEDEDWENDLETMTDAPFVELVSDKALVTLPYQDYMTSPIEDVESSFETIHKVIDWEDELAGFDGSAPENVVTNNRIHYLIDIYATPEDAKKFYMYASNYFIGMKKINFTELTHKLDKEWGIWHETGHTHQQRSWTFSAITEISTNIFSLYVQEKFGQPSRLNTIMGGDKAKPFDNARNYLNNPDKDYLVINKSDYSEFFSKLVMFHQLKAVYGWNIFKKLHQYFRKQPYVYNPKETDQDKANKFVYAMCLLTKNDLVPFFEKWGLKIDRQTKAKIEQLKFSAPKVDPAMIFR
ncbi:MAG TPA: M60 family metallopeptidase [Pyrinomonadaceae bacterium]|nr:M60 family metallopeptidase [Pyrinomonadaceae bacterium]